MYCFGSGGEAIRQLVDGYVSSNLSLLCFVVGGFCKIGRLSRVNFNSVPSAIQHSLFEEKNDSCSATAH